MVGGGKLSLIVLFITIHLLVEDGNAQSSSAGNPDTRSRPSIANQEVAQNGAARPTGKPDRNNAWTIGLAAGLPEGTFLPFAAEIARNLNQGDQIRVIPMVTPGATDNIRDLLFLKGVDVAITHTDVLEHFKSVERVPRIEQRIHYVASLYASEIHVVARPEIGSLRDLEGKKVGFHTKGSGSTTSAPLIFSRLGIKVEPVFVSNSIALEQMKTGELAAIVHNGGKPNNLLTRFRNNVGFKLLEIPLDRLDDYYVPSTLTAEDYPNFIKPGERVHTIAVQAVLAVYNWPARSERARRTTRFIDHFFDKFETFKGPGYQPQWQEINLGGSVPGWTRHGRAESKLRQLAPPGPQPPAKSPSYVPGKTNTEAPQAPRFQHSDAGGSSLVARSGGGLEWSGTSERELVSGK